MFPNPNNNRNNDDKKPGSNPSPPNMPEWRRWIWPALSLLILLWVFVQFSAFGGNTQAQEIPYNLLLEQAEAGNVDEIAIRASDATGRFEAPVLNPATNQEITDFRARLLPGENDNQRLTDALLNSDAEIIPQSNDTSPLLVILANWVPLLLIIGFFIWTARRAQRQMNGAFGFGRTQAREYTVERPQVTFEDVAGQDAAKNELKEIVDFLREPDKYIALGARIPRGVLLIGPPGTGKTLLARAVAGEASVSFFSIAASEFVEMFVGVGASRVRDLFKRAKDNAPSIVFIDEIDAVGRQRGAGLGGGNDEREQTLNQMLAEMDGFDQTESVIVMAATNRPDVLDPALLRPGRFDRQVTVDVPDRAGRFSILKIHTRGKPLDSSVDLEMLARGTIGFSGADLANLANEAALTAARRNAKKITRRDFSDAFDRIVLGTERPPLSNVQERRVVAFHEAGHALVATLTPAADPINKVTIVPRGRALGVAFQLPLDDIRNVSRTYLNARMKVALGGRAAEQIVFGEITSGAESDLRYVTSSARRMVAQFGMSEAIGPLNFGDDDRQPFLGYSLSQGRNYSEETAAKIDTEVRRIVDEAYETTLELLSQNRDKLEALAEALLTHEVVDQEMLLEVTGLNREAANVSNAHFTDKEKAEHTMAGMTPTQPDSNGGQAHTEEPTVPGDSQGS
ncbi:MAG: ATP-dependent zinc metalloprotease FtsH [bacterium]|nr:ATP-dependent zinc metalloprotease FtsH [bacterium]